MKNLIKKVLLFPLFFLAFSILLNSIYLIVITSTDWNFSKRIESLRFKDPDFELLVLGTSLADYGVDTELLSEKGIKSFNLALVGSSVKTCYIQLEEYITKYENPPRYVLLLVNSFLEVFDQDGIQPVVEFTMKGQDIDLKDFPLSKFQWQTMELIKKAFSSEYRRGYISYGQTRREKVVPDNSGYKNLEIDIEKFESAVWIGEIAELCNNNGIEFLVIEIPGVNETQNLSEMGPYTLNCENDYTAKLYNLNSQEFCSYIDTQNDWGGMSHFNEKGAARFTIELLSIINSMESDQMIENRSE